MLCCALIPTLPSEAQTAADLGRPIVDIVDQLRDQDIRIIYSDELLPARLRMTVVPAAAEPFDQLTAILAPHGLALELGPRDTWLIVRGTAPAQPPADASSPTTVAQPSLETLVVTASRYSIERPSAISEAAITRHTLENTTALGQDPLRVTNILPGVTSNQLSSRMHVRGGDLDEALLRLDGVRLYTPYHLKDFQAVFSSINPRVVESVDVRTGGYEARFGDRMSGVIDMESQTPLEPRHFELAASLLESSVLSSGVFAEGRGSWLTSLRRGNLDLLADQVDSNAGQPQYFDFFNKVQFAPTSRSLVTGGILTLDDKIALSDGDVSSATADYDDTYYWVTLARSGDRGFESRYQLVSSKLIRTRHGVTDDPERSTGFLDETATFDRAGLTADFGRDFSDRLRVDFGFDVESIELAAEVAAVRTTHVTIRADDLAGANAPPAQARVDYSQARRAVYMTWRLRPLDRLTLELGVRADEQSLTHERQTSPRLSMLFDAGARTSLRAAWGRYSQSQWPDELALADGLDALQPAAEAEHLIFGIEHSVGSAAMLRVEAYSKDIARPTVGFENIYERVSLIPELLPDRFAIAPRSARLRGIEIGGEGTAGAFDWWGSLTWSEAGDRLATGQFARSWDERWSLKLGGEWSTASWDVSANAVVHTGWPISTLELIDGALVAGSFNGLRLSNFASLDARAARSTPTRRGELGWFVEVTNLLNRSNDCCVSYRYVPASASGPESLELERDDLLGIVPNVGVRWQF